MEQDLSLPAELAQRAERDTWFNAGDALQVLDWLEGNGCSFLGFDSARKELDGSWVLLPEPILDVSSSQTTAHGVAFARELIGRHPDLMFDLAWDEAK